MDKLLQEISIEKELQPLAEELPKVWKQFDQEIINFLETVQSDNQN